MGAGAVASVTHALSNADIPRAAELAAVAVDRHQLPRGLDMAPVAFRAVLARGVADDFAVAAICAGFVGLAASVMLVVVVRRVAGTRLVSLSASEAPLVAVVEEEDL